MIKLASNLWLLGGCLLVIKVTFIAVVSVDVGDQAVYPLVGLFLIWVLGAYVLEGRRLETLDH